MTSSDPSSDAYLEDRLLLVRAACSILLQREIALSRRVYTWLLGTQEGSQAQVDHFKSFGLDMLANSLQVSYHAV